MLELAERICAATPRPLLIEFGELDDEPSLYIQACGQLQDCTLEDMLALHEVLRPVLPRPFNERTYAESIMAQALEVRAAFV